MADNGNVTDAVHQERLDTLEGRLDRHESECRRRHDVIDTNFREVFRRLGGLEGDVKAMKAKQQAWYAAIAIGVAVVGLLVQFGPIGG